MAKVLPFSRYLTWNLILSFIIYKKNCISFSKNIQIKTLNKMLKKLKFSSLKQVTKFKNCVSKNILQEVENWNSEVTN